MSGMVAVIHWDGTPVDEAVFRHMLNRMEYRATGGLGMWINGNVALGHALYKTHDGDIPQPYSLEHITITAHVRIDAREELIPRLRSAGVEASLHAPDVELLAKAYLAWGESCLDYLLGDFSFVLWDAQKQRVFAARDHFGMWPLYYAQIGAVLIISTEMGAIRRHPLVSERLNETAVGDFLVIHNITWLDKTQTIFADIQRLMAAHRIIATQDDLSIREYWEPPIDDPMLRYRSEDEYVEHFLSIFRQAVKDRMRSKKIVLQLSGGLDSPSIAAIANDLVQDGTVNAELTAYTSVCHYLHPSSEGFYARRIAEKLDLKQEFFVIDEFPFAQPLDLAAEPAHTFQRGIIEASISKIRSLGFIALAGHGADEILTHTPFIDILRKMPPANAADLLLWEWRFLGHKPRGLGDIFKRRYWRKAFARSNFSLPVWLEPEFAQRLELLSRLKSFQNWQPAKEHPLHQQAYWVTRWADRTVNGENLYGLRDAPYEMLCPFLDVRLVRFILTLSPQPWFTQKYLLRRAMQGKLPEVVLTRPKVPGGRFADSLLMQKSAAWADLWEPVPELNAYVRREAIPPLSRDQGSKNISLDIRPLMLNEWLQHYREI